MTHDSGLLSARYMSTFSSVIRVARDPGMRTKSLRPNRPKQREISNWAGWFLLILSVIVLTGYAFRLAALERFVPESVEMKANSALAMLLAGIALLRRK